MISPFHKTHTVINLTNPPFGDGLYHHQNGDFGTDGFPLPILKSPLLRSSIYTSRGRCVAQLEF